MPKTKHPESVPLVNNHGFSDWFCDRSGDGLAGFTRMHFLCKDNRAAFKRFWGPRNRMLRSEFEHHIWDVTFEGKHFVAFTAAGKGTSFEYAEPGTDYDTIREASLTPLFIRFAEYVYKEAFTAKEIKAFMDEMRESLRRRRP